MMRKLSRYRSSRWSRLDRLLDEAGHGVARLRAFADPVLRAIQLEREIFTRLERLVGADFLDALAVARAAAVGHHNAIHRGVFSADPFHANFYRHKCFKRTWRLAIRAPLGKLVLTEKLSPRHFPT